MLEVGVANLPRETISQSRIMSYVGCGYRYWFGYEFGGTGYSPIIASSTPTLGSAGHEAMAAAILGGSIDEALEKWKQNYVLNHTLFGLGDDEIIRVLGEQATEIQQQASIIVPRAIDKLYLPKWEILEYRGKKLVEVKFAVPMNNPRFKYFVFVVDLVAKDLETGLTWLVDHKFRKQLQDEETEEVNLQMPTYEAGLFRMDIHTDGSMSNQILAKVPSLPKQNKDGSMSRARIATTWDTYKQCLIEKGLNPMDYLEMVDKLNVEFFRQIYTYRGEVQIQNSWSEIIEPRALEMATSPSFVRNLGSMGCRKCWAREYCMEALRGGDLEDILETQYMPRSLAHHYQDVYYEEVEVETSEG